MIATEAGYQRFAHKSELGDVITIYRDHPGIGTKMSFVLAWILMSALTLINPAETVLMAFTPTVAYAVIWLLIYIMISQERLVVCQWGVLIGSVAPFLKPYPIRYDQIIVGSVVPISDHILRYRKQSGQYFPVTRTVRLVWWNRRGVAMAGPTRYEARHQQETIPPEKRSDRWGTAWLIGTVGPAEDATADIARAAHAAGFEELAQATAQAPPRALTGKPADAATQLPGIITTHHLLSGPGSYSR